MVNTTAQFTEDKGDWLESTADKWSELNVHLSMCRIMRHVDRMHSLRITKYTVRVVRDTM